MFLIHIFNAEVTHVSHVCTHNFSGKCKYRNIFVSISIYLFKIKQNHAIRFIKIFSLQNNKLKIFREFKRVLAFLFTIYMQIGRFPTLPLLLLKYITTSLAAYRNLVSTILGLNHSYVRRDKVRQVS